MIVHFIIIFFQHMTTHYKDTELVGKDCQTDKQLLVDKLTQTERFTYDQSKETADLSSTFTEAQSNTNGESQSSKYADRFNINQVSSVNVGRPGRTQDMDMEFPEKGTGLDISRDISEPDFERKPALSGIPKTSANEANFVKISTISCMPNSSTDDGPALNVGINVRDLEISESVKTVSRFVEVDPKEYALALTPQTKKDNQTGKGGKSLNLDTANSDSYVNDVLIDGNEAIELIDDSDGDDVVDPSQPCPKMMEISDDKLDNNPGSKHRLSLSGKRGNTCGEKARQGKQDRDTEASCSATKHLKFSESDQEACGYTADTDKADGSINKEDALKELTLSRSGGRHRIVARSGQKVDNSLNSVAPRKAKTQLSFGLPGSNRGNASHVSLDTVATGINNTARSKDDAQVVESVTTSTINNKFSNQISHSLANCESMQCQSNSFADIQSSYSSTTPAGLPSFKSIVSSENMHNLSEPSRSLSTSSPSSLRPNQRTVASNQFSFGIKPTTLPNELSNTPSLLSSSGPEVTQTSVSMPTVSQQVPIGTSTSQLATSSNATGNHQAGTLQLLSSSTASGSEGTITRSVEQSLPSASGSVLVPSSVPITRTLSSKPTSSSAATVQQPESRTSPNETEPAFLKKYREIVAKIKPISTPVQVSHIQ